MAKVDMKNYKVTTVMYSVCTPAEFEHFEPQFFKKLCDVQQRAICEQHLECQRFKDYISSDCSAFRLTVQYKPE